MGAEYISQHVCERYNNNNEGNNNIIEITN